MAAVHHVSEPAHETEGDRLDALLSDVRQNGTRRVFDRDGNIFELHQVDLARPEVSGGPEPGESVEQWLDRTLPPGEPIDDDGLRNPERAGLYPAWMGQMWEDAEENDQPEEPRCVTEQHD